MIISASRRTDIPAFYNRWFINRILEGYLLTRNPYNPKQVKRVSLAPEDVDVIVFWTRNPARLIPELNIIDGLGYKYYFQYTITGYPRTIETSVPNTYRAIDTFINLSNKIGKDRVIWRYDPIIASNLVDTNEHKRLFSKIAHMLHDHTNTVVISFVDFYKKTESNLKKISNLKYFDITKNNELLLDLAEYMARTANSLGLKIQTCSEFIDLESIGIPHGKCIDDELIKDVFNINLNYGKDKGQRDECGCIKSIDIGSYNTCLHGCSYCYATFNKNAVINNHSKHNENSPFLIGEDEDHLISSPGGIQNDLF